MDFKGILRNLTLANQLTFLRLVAIPFFILAVLEARFGLALGLFIAAAITDLLDGVAARAFKQGTPLGAYLDPAADKLLMTAAFILLTGFPNMFQEIPMVNRLPIWLTILAISRDVFIVSISLMMYLAYGSTRFTPTIWGKLTTLAEIITLSLFLLFNQLGMRHLTLEIAVWVTLALILISGLHYLWLTGQTVRAEEEETSAMD
jgi:cardiolipin synthase